MSLPAWVHLDTDWTPSGPSSLLCRWDCHRGCDHALPDQNCTWRSIEGEKKKKHQPLRKLWLNSDPSVPSEFKNICEKYWIMVYKMCFNYSSLWLLAGETFGETCAFRSNDSGEASPICRPQSVSYKAYHSFTQSICWSYWQLPGIFTIYMCV